LAFTVVADPRDQAPDALLDEIRAVWAVVATWGRWCDEEAGEWPSIEDCLSHLPSSFRHRISSASPSGTQGWLEALHDRDWIWWSAAVVDGYVKVDLDSDSSPLSTYALRFVLETCGGTIVFDDVSVDAKTLLERVDR